MESKNQYDEGTSSDEGQPSPFDGKKTNPSSRFLKLSNSTKMSKVNTDVSCSSKNDILIPENDTKADRQKFQTSSIKRQFQREKHRFKINSEKLVMKKSPNESICSDTLHDEIIEANDDCSPIVSDDSGLSESDDMQQENWFTSSPSNTEANNFNSSESKEISYTGNKSSGSSLDVHQSINMPKPSSSQHACYQSDQRADKTLESKSAILRFLNTWDLSKISSGSKTNDEVVAHSDNSIPDLEFMEADIFPEDKVIDPATEIYESRRRVSEDDELELPMNLLTCSPEKATMNDFNIDRGREIVCEENKAADAPIVDIEQGLDMLKQLLPQVEQSKNAWYNQSDPTSDERFINESLIWKLTKIRDLSKTSSESETRERTGERTEKGLPDDVFMEADRYHGDKGKQPASKRYAYKKKSKSTENQSTIDLKNGTDTHMECDIETDNQTSSSSPLSSIAPLSFENETTCAISEHMSSESRELNFASEDIKESAVEWNFHDYAFKTSPVEKKLSDLPTEYRNYNNNLFRNENYFDSQYSDEDYNLQKGLLLSLQSINTSNNNNDDDSDVDIMT